VEDCQDDDAFRLNHEEDSIWKSSNQHATDLAMHGLVVLRILVCLLDRLVKLARGPVTKSLKL
jgi:hypothetical protein